jgi:hypothetical protein
VPTITCSLKVGDSMRTLHLHIMTLDALESGAMRKPITMLQYSMGMFRVQVDQSSDWVNHQLVLPAIGENFDYAGSSRTEVQHTINFNVNDISFGRWIFK